VVFLTIERQLQALEISQAKKCSNADGVGISWCLFLLGITVVVTSVVVVEKSVSVEVNIVVMVLLRLSLKSDNDE